MQSVSQHPFESVRVLPPKQKTKKKTSGGPKIDKTKLWDIFDTDSVSATATANGSATSETTPTPIQRIHGKASVTGSKTIECIYQNQPQDNDLCSLCST